MEPVEYCSLALPFVSLSEGVAIAAESVVTSLSGFRLFGDVSFRSSSSLFFLNDEQLGTEDLPSA